MNSEDNHTIIYGSNLSDCPRAIETAIDGIDRFIRNK